MKQIELTSKLALALIAAIVVFSAMTVPTLAQNAPKIPNSYITSGMIRDGEVKTADLADNAVTAAKIADGTIQKGDIANDAIPPDTIGSLQTTIKLKTFTYTAGNVPVQPKCDEGQVVVGGGYDIAANAGTGLITASASYPLDSITWEVLVQPTGDIPDEGIPIKAYAVCAEITQ